MGNPAIFPGVTSGHYFVVDGIREFEGIEYADIREVKQNVRGPEGEPVDSYSVPLDVLWTKCRTEKRFMIYDAQLSPHSAV